MPKRKRSVHRAVESDPAQKLELQRKQVEEKLVNGKKLLNRALKTAKNFERRRLARRLKTARDEKDGMETTRLQREFDVLKAIKLSNAMDTYLYKSLLKSKRVLESGLLPDYVKADVKKGNDSEEELLAASNVTARMYNTKPVKNAVAEIFSSVYSVLKIAQPGRTLKAGEKITADSQSEVRGISKDASNEELLSEDEEQAQAQASDNDSSRNDPLAWEGLDPGPGSDSDKSEDFSCYDGLIAGSSDDECSEAILSANEIQRPSATSRRRNTPRDDLSPSPSGSEAEASLSQSASPSPPCFKKVRHADDAAKSKKQPTSNPTSRRASTFLPTLMGGYWSGSEDAASGDDDDLAGTPTPRKNRRGQQARRAIWEKKFGVQAKHLQAPATGKIRDRDWDPRRGARETAGRGRGRGRGAGKAKAQAKARCTGDNTVALGVKARAKPGAGKKGDGGPLHPSWEAARRAKEAKTTAKFQGTKVVFT